MIYWCWYTDWFHVFLIFSIVLVLLLQIGSQPGRNLYNFSFAWLRQVAYQFYLSLAICATATAHARQQILWPSHAVYVSAFIPPWPICYSVFLLRHYIYLKDRLILIISLSYTTTAYRRLLHQRPRDTTVDFWLPDFQACDLFHFISRCISSSRLRLPWNADADAFSPTKLT
jgi:hypothetical protein